MAGRKKIRKGLHVLARAGRAEWALLTGQPLRGDPGFAQQAARLWLRTLAADALPPIRGRILITAMRNTTWIEWAAYAAGVLRRAGFASTLVFSGRQMAALYRAPGPWNFWRRVRAIPGIELIDLDAVAPVVGAAERLLPLARSAAAATLAYDLHVEEADITGDPARYAAALDRAARRAAQLGAALDDVIGRRTFDRFLCYSGLIAESPTFLAVARTRGLTTVCLEGWGWRPGHMIYNLNAPALEYNVGGWLRAAGEWDATKEREIASYLKFLDGEKFNDAEWLANFYRVQRDRTGEQLPAALAQFLAGPEPVFLLAPNVIGDSSILRRETLFASQQAWLREMIAWFAQRPGAKLVIRAHPGEVWMGGKCTLHMGPWARRLAAGCANIRVIDATEKVNTFSLIPHARAGLAWLSSAGVDFVVRGLPAMVAARPKYEGMGIVEEPPTREEYFAVLERWLRAPERPTPERMLAGRRYLHVVFKGFSFEAGARNYRATGLRLGTMINQAEHDRFYRILTGDEPMPDVAPAEVGA